MNHNEGFLSMMLTNSIEVVLSLHEGWPWLSFFGFPVVVLIVLFVMDHSIGMIRYQFTVATSPSLIAIIMGLAGYVFAFFIVPVLPALVVPVEFFMGWRRYLGYTFTFLD